MKKSNILLLAVAALGLGFTAVTTATTETAHAAYYYWTKTKNYSPTVAMKQKNPGTTAYMWNAHHTARLHNLKNYPRTTWYLSKSVKMTRGSKSAIYYRVTSGSGKVTGYVWRGYLTTGVNTSTGSSTTTNTGSSTQSFTKASDSVPALSNFTTSAQYSAFIQAAPLQSAARAVLAAFPNATLDLNLSRYARKYATLSDDVRSWYSTKYDASQITSKPVELKRTESYISQNHPKGSTPNSALLLALEEDGYTASKRTSFSGKIGVCLVDGISESDGTYIAAYGIYLMN